MLAFLDMDTVTSISLGSSRAVSSVQQGGPGHGARTEAARGSPPGQASSGAPSGPSPSQSSQPQVTLSSVSKTAMEQGVGVQGPLQAGT